MDIILIILGVLGFGAIVIAAYVFTVAARNYVSDNGESIGGHKTAARKGRLRQRAATDRRRGSPVKFPLTVNSVVIPEDRRKHPDRRLAA